MQDAVQDTAGTADAAQEGILRRQSLRESAARTYARALPIVPVRARGMTIEGADGRRYLDCLSGAGSLALGHNHPVVLEAIRSVLDSGAPLHALDLATPVKDAFTTELFRTLPGDLADRARVQFCGPAGSDAVEAAIKLVRTATGRSGLLAFSGAYHGMTAGALEASGGAQDVRVARLPYPYDYRCPFGVGGARGAELSARWTEQLLDDPKSGVPLPAGMLVEPVQGEGGVIPAPGPWLRRMRELTAARGIPLIADEVQTGVGRTGAFWAVEHSGVVPDVMVLSKAIGGSLPLAVVVYRDDLDLWEPGAHAGTFRGNQLAMAAGAATLAYVRENGLAERAAVLGGRMLERLRRFAAEQPCVGDVRGSGLMIGLELVAAEAGEAPFRRAAGPDGNGPARDGRGCGDRSGSSGPFGAGEPGGISGGRGTGGIGRASRNGTGGECGNRDNGPADDCCHSPADDRCHGNGSQEQQSRRKPGSPGRDSTTHRGNGRNRSHGSTDAYLDGPGRSGGTVDDGGAVPGGGVFDVPATGGTSFGGGPPAAPLLAAEVQQECLRRGLIVELGGRYSSVVRLLPPLTITDEQAEAVLDRLTDAISSAVRNGGAVRDAYPPVPRPPRPAPPGTSR
ncbi:diaminobutyrate--2-oxoglutarate transaminase family protein [Streptomyces sp. bgisy100]|uniref:diaminobutyrate--2-oxoglutarate transaminase family protein n=1 Tax=Streptomyces sp. bgisy100 TaxID=3413783 RepID=UPI003D72CFF4